MENKSYRIHRLFLGLLTVADLYLLRMFIPNAYRMLFSSGFDFTFFGMVILVGSFQLVIYTAWKYRLVFNANNICFSYFGYSKKLEVDEVTKYRIIGKLLVISTPDSDMSINYHLLESKDDLTLTLDKIIAINKGR